MLHVEGMFEMAFYNVMDAIIMKIVIRFLRLIKLYSTSPSIIASFDSSVSKNVSKWICLAPDAPLCPDRMDRSHS